MKQLRCFGVLGAVVLLFVGIPSMALGGILYPDPAGGWDYGYYANAGEDAAGPLGDFDALDGHWDHNNGSDAWDGSGIGAGVAGGASVFSDDGTSFLRLEDPGDPRDHGVSDPSNRKVYFGYSITDNQVDPDVAANILDGVTLTFRARVATGGVLDAMYPDSASDGENYNLPGGTAWPEAGNGYLGHDSGKGNFSVRQSEGDQILSFSLALPTETMKYNRDLSFSNAGGQAGLVLNSLRTEGADPDEDPWEYNGDGEQLNLLPLDPTLWHEFWVTIEPDTDGPGSHLVKVYKDGSLVADAFSVSTGGGNDYDISYLGMGVGATGQMGAIDVDFFAYKAGVSAPVPEPATWALLAVAALGLLLWRRR